MNPDVVIVGGIAAIVLLLVVLSTYNALTQLRQDVRSAWLAMDNQLKNRYLLVPALVSIVQNTGGPAAEKLAAVTTAKNQAAVAFNPVQLADAESALTRGIQQVLAAGDQQEGLKTDPRFVEIREQLLRSENQIAQSSRRYNDQVDALNASMTSFPYVITARAIGLRLQPMFGVVIVPTGYAST